MYEAVHVAPEGDSPVAEVAVTAETYGFDGIVIRNHNAAIPDNQTTIRESTEIDVVTGIELRADDPSQLGGMLETHRSTTTIVLVHGGQESINRYAVNQPRVDVLAHPTRDGGEVDDVLVRAAATHDVRLEFDFSRVLRASDGTRVRAITQLRKLRELVNAYDAPYVVSTDPSSHLQLRAPRDLTALGTTLGFTRHHINTGLTEWQRLTARNRDRLSDDYIEPGVRRGGYHE